MSDMENWCTNQTAKLLNEELRLESLQEILDHLSNIPRDEAIRTTRYLELSAVFDCLNDTNSTQVELACDVLTVCMSNLSLGDTTNRYSSFLERALNHPNDSVKIMALREILRNSANEDSLMILINQNNLLHMTIKCVGNENLSVAKEAIAILINIVKSSDGIQKLLSPDSISIINDIMSTNEIIRLRFNEMFINGAKESEKFMKGLIVTGLLPKFVSELDSPDDLLKLNIVELLTELAITEHGYLYLESAGVIGKIYKQFNTNDAIWSDLCKPGILKFFGNISFWRPKETLDKYPEIINNIFSNIESNNLVLLGVSLDTVGHIAERNEGKLALSSRGDQFITVLQVMCDRLSSLPADLRIRALRCIESLIRITVFNSDITSLIHKWFSLMNENSMDLIYKNAKNPFIDIRLAGLSVLNAMALHTWGHECFRETPGFVEFLLDRRSESAKECKEIKYDIIKILATSTLFEHNTLTRFQEYVQEGPFYVQAITQVAVEGED